MALLKSILGKLFLLWTMAIMVMPSFAQRPPTSGPNPSESSGISPLLLIGGGAALGTASFLHFRSKKMTKLPLSERLPSYLLSRNFLPTTDALNLMYWLNPELDSNEHIKANKKLVMPSFPEMGVKTPDEKPVLEEWNVNLKGLSSKNEEINTTYLAFSGRDSGGEYDYMVSNRVNASMKRLREMEITAFLKSQEENPVVQQLVLDLLIAFEDALRTITEAKEEPEHSVALLEAIVENLSEITSDLKLLSWRPKLDQSEVNDPRGLLASISKPAVFSGGRDFYEELEFKNNAMLKGFAFAVFKRNEAGEIITKGPEVEGRYNIKYVAPALKDIPQAYHPLLGPATYATAHFPPARLLIVVEDISGKQVHIPNKLINFKEVFANPQYGLFEEYTIVPIFIPQ